MKKSLIALMVPLGVATAAMATYPPSCETQVANHHAREIRIAYAAFHLDEYVRDLFVFTPPVTQVVAAPVGVPVGGRKASGSLQAVIAEDLASDDGVAIVGYENGVNAGDAGGGLLLRALSSMQAGMCASCHNPAKARGGVSLFADNAGSKLADKIDWQAVFNYTGSKDASPPPCPPSGKPLTDSQREPFRLLAK